VPRKQYEKNRNITGRFTFEFVSDITKAKIKIAAAIKVPETTVTLEQFNKMNCTQKLSALTKIFVKDMVEKISMNDTIPCVRKKAYERMHKPYVKLV
jgi:hypothetical protein